MSDGDGRQNGGDRGANSVHDGANVADKNSLEDIPESSNDDFHVEESGAKDAERRMSLDSTDDPTNTAPTSIELVEVSSETKTDGGESTRAKSNDKAQNVDESLLLSFKPPQSKFDHGWRKKINIAVNSAAWDIVFLVLTFYALYAVDLNVRFAWCYRGRRGASINLSLVVLSHRRIMETPPLTSRLKY